MAQCPTCGAEVEENQDICMECGTDLRTAVTIGPKRAHEEGEAAEAVPAEQPQEAVRVPVEERGEPVSEEVTPEAQEIAHEEPSLAPTPVPSQTMTGVGEATLTLRRGGAATSEAFSLGERAIIGRFDPETGPVDVDLGPLPESIYISRQHAEIYKNPSGQWMIRDLGSANGTFIRSVETGKFERVQGEREIDDGEEIALGNARFTFNAR